MNADLIAMRSGQPDRIGIPRRCWLRRYGASRVPVLLVQSNTAAGAGEVAPGRYTVRAGANAGEGPPFSYWPEWPAYSSNTIALTCRP